MRGLVGDTIIYGGGTILVRLLNWLLMPYYIRTMDSVQYGYITEIYSFIAILLVLLTYGFETSFFRFSKKESYRKVFTTGLTSIVSTSLLFLFIVFVTLINIDSSEFSLLYKRLIVIGGCVVSLDAITSIIFAKLRFQSKSIKFAILKFINVFILIFFNLFFLLFIPYLKEYDILHSTTYFSLVSWFYIPDYESVYVLISNLIASVCVLLILIPEIIGGIDSVDLSLLKKMFKYSFPILIVGITGMINQNIDKTLIPRIIGGEEGYKMVAIYGANFKIGILMAMFTQSFRLAFEPYFFKHHQTTKDTSVYSTILTYFVLFGFLIFLGVSLFIGVINLLLTEEYIQGNGVIPIILLSQLFSGIYFTLSVWYKVSDKTKYGAYMGIIGTIITIVGNILLIPILGYYGSALSGLLCFILMVFMSVYLGRKHYFIHYEWKKIINYFFLVLVLFISGYYILPVLMNKWLVDYVLLSIIVNYFVRIGLIIVFLGFVFKYEYPKLRLKVNVSKN